MNFDELQEALSSEPSEEHLLTLTNELIDVLFRMIMSEGMDFTVNVLHGIIIGLEPMTTRGKN